MNAHGRFSRRSFLVRSVATTLAIAGGGVALSGPHGAGAQAGDYELVSEFNGVRVRSAPSLSGAVIGTVNAGGVVSVTGQTVLADGYSWVPVWVHGANINGYVAGEFFRRASGEPGWIRGTPVHVDSYGVNLRAGAGLGYRVLGTYPIGTNAVVNDGPGFADGYAWYSLTIDGATGWMVANYLAHGHTAGPVPDDGAFRVGAYVRPTSALNLRSGAGTGHSVVKVLSTTDIGTVSDGPRSADGYAWYNIILWDAAETNGWVAGEFLEHARFEPTGARHRVTDGPLNLRAWGGLAAPVVTAIPTGDVFVIADASLGSADGYTWASAYLERDSSVRGWVALGFSEEI